ncbi:phage major capsid protein [Acidovorax sp. NPDC077693]|uniref:phage major capsid protein n=1 Tax=unclassified Acidovorax TaxID=2684926 RepID=UPI0037C87868
MSLVLQLRSERAKLNDELQALAKKEAGGVSLAAEELERFTKLEADIADLSAKIARAEAAERVNASVAVPVNESAQGNNSPPVHITVHDNAPRASGVAQMARLLAATQGNQVQAAELARAGNYPEQVVMALSTTTPGAGGVLVPTNLAREVIESLRPTSVLRSFGARPLPLYNGNMTLPRIKGNTTVGYIGVDTDIPVTTMVFEDLKLQAKKLGALVPIANDLLRFQGTNPQVDQIVAGDMFVSAGLYEDLTFIRSAGGPLIPKGLRYWAAAGNVVVAPAGVTMADIDAFCGGLMLRVEMANANMAGCGWIMNPRTIRFLQMVRDGNGNLAYPEINDGKFKGYPFKLSTQIPINLGAGADESEIYFGDYSDCYIGETGEMYLAYSTEASYKDGNGDLVSAFSRDQTLVRLTQHNDFGPRHVESIAVGTGVKWGKAMLA